MTRQPKGSVEEPDRTAARTRHHVVVLPAFNEGAVIRKVIHDVASALDAAGRNSYEIIVVDDGSGDQTSSEAEASAASGLPVTVIRHPVNRGLGAGLKTGLLAALQRCQPGDIVLTTEADGSQPSDKLVELADRIEEGFNFAVATPLAARGGFEGVPWYRRLLSRGGNLVYGLLFPTRGLTDFTNLVRAYDAGLLQAGLERFGPGGFIDQTGFDCVPDIVLKLRKVGLRPCQVPITINHDLVERDSSMNVLRTIRRSLVLCARHRLGLVRRRD